ncbi:glycosyltransferase family 2 protein [Melissococcus plutonius]|uniref:Glycosyl transferase, family 2 n=1 Tax=Melissococcus plutonius (strain ATCC 35311 / DSM 29964 / CIP 104052 / LMG 20360 / NCIMB 702443) TaxID=940190 RepID=F3Y9T6_MELPT|nr:glycosyltransferase family 2 protein [Melissococcus plutonius]AIM24796.1 glycosyl transferase, group 2 family protein [Melissococcus plutonius S1]KMT24913.1 glycosyl transferase, group 2 family protein [Melissococcus plutonius]KMT26550.1 glycosyl transferase, group 2 family protein [Melissococcus plutonius]KMT27800.1 glycosyl transferase, group 2 family protein [Melissococcus plutonius]KMT29572.1 glycosyl transferase, group 2 family protein [Melissococcus plutonius]
MQEKIIISIVTYNSSYIFEVLDQLKEELGMDSSYAVHIFDNHSDPVYVKQLESYLPFITLHKEKENIGFGKGHNWVFNHTEAKTGIIFNPDVLVNKKTLNQLVTRLKAEEDLAAVCPKVLNEDGTTQYLVRQKLDVFDYILRFIPFHLTKKIFDKRLNFYECRDLSDTKTTYIKMGSGCFMVIDIEKYKQIGGFDDRFFMYFEDNDLCLRFGKAGYRILYSPLETVTHMYEKGAHKNKKLFRIFIQSMIKFFNKWGWRFF